MDYHKPNANELKILEETNPSLFNIMFNVDDEEIDSLFNEFKCNTKIELIKQINHNKLISSTHIDLKPFLPKEQPKKVITRHKEAFNKNLFLPIKNLHNAEASDFKPYSKEYTANIIFGSIFQDANLKTDYEAYLNYVCDFYLLIYLDKLGLYDFADRNDV